ncbi:hypothetical protein IGB42_03941 [Andreprevotia sp. IGB-42]|nr:hypothetical protein IGB42_03941 [Andreprevotia sp. IGB-42]
MEHGLNRGGRREQADLPHFRYWRRNRRRGLGNRNGHRVGRGEALADRQVGGINPRQDILDREVRLVGADRLVLFIELGNGLGVAVVLRGGCRGDIFIVGASLEAECGVTVGIVDVAGDHASIGVAHHHAAQLVVLRPFLVATVDATLRHFAEGVITGLRCIAKGNGSALAYGLAAGFAPHAVVGDD